MIKSFCKSFHEHFCISKSCFTYQVKGLSRCFIICRLTIDDLLVGLLGTIWKQDSIPESDIGSSIAITPQQKIVFVFLYLFISDSA